MSSKALFVLVSLQFMATSTVAMHSPWGSTQINNQTATTTKALHFMHTTTQEREAEGIIGGITASTKNHPRKMTVASQNLGPNFSCKPAWALAEGLLAKPEF